MHLNVASAANWTGVLVSHGKNDSVAEVANLLRLELKLLVSADPILKHATDRRLTLVSAQPNRRQV